MASERSKVAGNREAEIRTEVRPVLPVWRQQLPFILAVGLGGVIGANVRWRISEWSIERWGAEFPWGTLIANLAGSFLLGFYLALFVERFRGRLITRLFIATGIFGSSTTFSTFVYEVVRLAEDGRVATAAVYIGVSLLLGLILCVIGITLARWIWIPGQRAVRSSE
jgi:fluoride exporter